MLSPEAKAAQDARPPKQVGRQRSRSGTGLLSKLSFLRLPTIVGSPNEKSATSEDGTTDDEEILEPDDDQAVDPRRAIELDRPAISDLQESYLKRTRKRAESLRKTALLGTRKLINEQRLSQLRVEHLNDADTAPLRDLDDAFDGESKETEHSHHGTLIARGPGDQVISRLDRSTAHGALSSTRAASHNRQPIPSPGSPRVSSSSSRRSDHGGLSDDAASLLSRRSTSSTIPSTLSAGSSQGLRRERKYGRKSSPLALPPQGPDSPAHGYETTARCGALILGLTWLVFVIGMGSCLDVWSWAWDVGETPYAPPELEDDETLPVTGYYPALLVCTAVMSWVWVISAWIGMKYFKHARGVVAD